MGDGEGVGDAVGVGEGLGVGVSVGEGLGVGDGDGVGEGVGVGPAPCTVIDCGPRSLFVSFDSMTVLSVSARAHML